jgi:hypothetical protein
MDLHELEKALGLASTSALSTPSRPALVKSSASSVASGMSASRHIQAVTVEPSMKTPQASHVVLVHVADASLSAHTASRREKSPARHVVVSEPVPKWLPVHSARPAGGTPSSKP